MSIFDNVFATPAGSANPIHQSVGNARTALGQGINHLLDALGHISAELQQAHQDVSMHADALASAQMRVDEFTQAAQHLAFVGQSVENLLAAGQPQTPAAVTQDIQEVESVITNGAAVIADTQAAVAPGGEPAAHV